VTRPANKSRTIIAGDVAVLILNLRYAAVIDAADAPLVGDRLWTAMPKPHGVYAYRKGPTGGTLSLHRELMQPPEGFFVDHIDGNPLNNRRSNLRLATPSENQWNQKRSCANTSGFKGVGWHERDRRWQARIRKEGKLYHLGNFKSPEEAHEAYCRAAAELHGEFARFA
jgi:hypothetical protein